MDFDWKKLVGAVAPAIGTALGTPAVGMAMQAIAAALGLSDASEATIEAAVRGASPADLLALKKADQDFAVAMKQLDIDLEKARLGDLDSARKREMAVQDKAVPRLAAVVIVGFLGMTGVILMGQAKVDSVLAGTLIGYVSGAATQVLSYYFGTSKSSNDKNALLQAKVGGK